MGILRAAALGNAGLGYMSPHDSGYDSSLQREYLHSTKYA